MLALLTAAFVLSSTAFAVAVPMFGNPDEATHVDMVRHYASHPTDMAGPSLQQTEGVRSALVATGMVDIPAESPTAAIPPSRPDYGPFEDYGGDAPAQRCPSRTCQNYQFIHPPGWYLAAAPVARVLDDRPFPNTVLALRLLNVLLCSVVVIATWAIARELWPSRPRLALVAAGCTAVCGPLAAAAASVNNDGLMLPLMAVALALMAGILRRGVTIRAAAVLGAIVALGLLVKGEHLVIAAVGLAAVLLAPVASNRDRWQAALVYLAVGGIGGLWWLRVFIDDRAVTPSGGELLAPPRTGPWNDEGIVPYIWGRLDTVIDWFPGRYGSYPWPFALLPSGLLLACQLGVVLLLAAWLVTRDWRRPTVASARVALLAAVPFLLFAASAYTAWDTYQSNGYHHGLAPRYVYGAVPIMAVMAAASLGAVRRRLRLQGVPALHAALLVGSAVLGTVVSLVVALHGMYFTTDWTTLFQRAGIMAPVAHVKAVLALVALLWTAAIAGAALLVWRRVEGATDAARPPAGSPAPS
ncbi:MAG TPA: glycosyltransferase family 39 protein [Acidimicrobiales bacterium]|nr:glycosyltransferase family 39 protein [Acidimicrobiales bacterium]